MTPIKLAQGAYGKFKVKVPGQNLTTSEQVHAFVYNERGQIIKSLSRESQSGYTTYEPVEGDNEAFFIKMVPADTRELKEGKYYVDVQTYTEVNGTQQPLHNPSFQDENVLFLLCKSVPKDKPAA